VKVRVNEIRAIQKLIKDINAHDFDQIEWLDQNDKPLKIDPEDRQDFINSGLANIQFADFLFLFDDKPPQSSSVSLGSFTVKSGTWKDLVFTSQGEFHELAKMSWRESLIPAAVNYGMRYLRDGLPADDNVLYGLIGAVEVCIHKSELELND